MALKQTAKTASSVLRHGRNLEPSYAYKQLSNVELDMLSFADQSAEANRSEAELSECLLSLHEHVKAQRRAQPLHRERVVAEDGSSVSVPLHKPLFDYSRTASTETDTRPP